MRINLIDAVDDMAPLTPPPCFKNRAEWMAYLKSAAQAQNTRGEPQVIVRAESGQITFNWHLSFCDDCTPEYKAQMQKSGMCAPNFLVDWFKAAGYDQDR